MVGMALPRPVVRSSIRVGPPQDGQAQIPPVSKLCLVDRSTWSQGSGHHSKMSVSQQATAHQHSQSFDVGSGWAVG